MMLESYAHLNTPYSLSGCYKLNNYSLYMCSTAYHCVETLVLVVRLMISATDKLTDVVLMANKFKRKT